MTAREVLAEAQRDRVFFDQSGGGISFSGGEPLAQPDFLVAMLRLCREAGIATAVDTCGYADQSAILAAAEYADEFLYDIKHLDTETHRQYTGVGNEQILANLVALSSVHDAVTARVPVIPGVNDDIGHIERVAAYLCRNTRIRRVTLLPYHASGESKYLRLGRPYRMAGTRTPSHEHMGKLAGAFAAAGLEPDIGG